VGRARASRSAEACAYGRCVGRVVSASRASSLASDVVIGRRPRLERLLQRLHHLLRIDVGLHLLRHVVDPIVDLSTVLTM
jgi:hypothetical protein